jgi:outer membrane protein OmpA-like peptidoglycan-associated protein
MQKKHLIIVLLMVACATMIDGCSGKLFTKSEGPASTKVVARPGDLPALVIDQRISDGPTSTKVAARPGDLPALNRDQRISDSAKASDSKKDKVSKVDKFKQENLALASSIEFEFAKHFVREQYRDGLKKVADSMKENPRTKAILKGHTDNIGSKAYNMRLSKVRANSVKLYMVKQFGIKRSRIAAFGYGFSKPVADNNTEEGRQKNRRVEIFIKGAEAK